jgi:hypothetical protein
MELDLSILNQKGSPAIYQDLFALRPTAGFTGRLFVSTDTDELYRDNGTTWDLIGGGGGGAVGDGISILGAGTVGSPFNTGLDAVLAIGQALTTDRSFKFNGFNVDFTDCDRVRYQLDSSGLTVFEINDTLNKVEIGYSQFKGTFTTSNFTIFNSLKGLIFDSNYFQLFDLNVSNWFGFQIDPLGTTKLGFDFNAHIGTGTKIIQTFFDTTNIEKGIKLDANFDIYQFGDWDSAATGGNQSNIELDSGGASCEVYTYNSVSGENLYWRQLQNIIELQYNGASNGLLLDFSNQIWRLGDYTGDAYFMAELAGNAVTIAGDLINVVGTVLTGSASGNSGQHLQVTINGTPYVIKLENP